MDAWSRVDGLAGWCLAADAAGAQWADVVADLFHCSGERGELSSIEVLDEVFLNPAVVHGARVL